MMPIRLRSFRRLSALTTVLLCAACDPDAAMQRMVTPDSDARARGYLALLARQQTDSALARLDASLMQSNTRETFARMAALAAGSRFDSMHVIGVQLNTLNGIRHTNLTYEYHVPTGWHAANVAWVDSANTWIVEGVSIEPLPAKLETMYAFANAPFRPVGLLWIALATMSAGLSIGSALFVGSRRGMPRRFVWSLVALVGVGAFRLNWTTGATEIALLQLLLAGAGVLRPSVAAPWILTFGIPIGALWSLRRWYRWRRSPLEMPPVSTARDA